MAYQLSLDNLGRNEVSLLQVPRQPAAPLLTASSASSGESTSSGAADDPIDLPREGLDRLVSVLQPFLLKLQEGAPNPLQTGQQWSDLVDPNVVVQPDGLPVIMQMLVKLHTKEARFLADRLMDQPHPSNVQDIDRVRSALQSFMQPLSSNRSTEGSLVASPPSPASPELNVPFAGPLATFASQYALELYRSKYPQNGNLSYAPMLGPVVPVDDILETQVSPALMEKLRHDVMRNTIISRSFYDGLRAHPEEDLRVAPSMRNFMAMCEEFQKSGIDPAPIIGAILTRNHQIAFAVSAFGLSLSFQGHRLDNLGRALIRALNEQLQYQKRDPWLVYQTPRVDGNLVPNSINHIRQHTVVDHYTHALFVYRHTDKLMTIYDYDEISNKLIFMGKGNCELEVEDLENVINGDLYHCYRGKDMDVKTSEQMKKVKWWQRSLPFIRKSRSSCLKGSLHVRALHLPGIAQQLGRNPRDMGCWRHMVSGRPPGVEDYETFLDANLIEVIALLSLWYKNAHFFQFTVEPVAGTETTLAALTSALGHVEYAVSDSDSDKMYSRVPEALGAESAFVTVLAHRAHPCWREHILWAGPLE